MPIRWTCTARVYQSCALMDNSLAADGAANLLTRPCQHGGVIRLVRTQGLTHIHLVVRDLDRSLQFYQSVFGMEELFREGTEMVFLRTPGSQDTITLNADPGEAHIAGAKGGVAHFGFRLQDKEDLDRAVAEVQAAGGKLLQSGEHSPGHPFAYVEDPDGFVIEF